MKKLKDFFSTLKTQGKIDNPEWDKFVDSIPDIEMPDPVFSSFENSFMTFDRAVMHPEIHAKIKRDALDPIDKQISGIVDVLKDVIDETKFKIKRDTPNTYELARDLKDHMPAIMKKLKGTPVTDDDTKKKLTEYEKTIQELRDQFTSAEQEYNTKVKANGEQWESKFHDFRLGSELEKRANKYTLAEPFEETRPAITEVIMSKLRQQHNLKLGETNGQPDIIVNDEHGKPKFNGNSPVTIESLLDEAHKPFLKKSETNGQTQVNPRTTTVQTNTKPTVRSGAPTTVVQKQQ